jgi:hypothetical protein
MRSPLVFLAIALTPAISSCVLIDAPSNHESHPVSADDFCTRAAEVICDGITHCCDQPTIVNMYRDRPTCVGHVSTGCMNGSPNIYQLVHAPVTGYDPALGGDVIAEARYRASICDTGVAAWLYQREGFLRVFPGTVAPGNSCLTGDPTAMSNAPDYVSCDDPGYACVLDTGLHHGNCSARVPAGRSCIVDLDCADGLYCAPGALVAGTCTPLLAAGGACTHNLADQGAWCQSGVCTMGTCQEATRTSVYCTGALP